MISASGLTKYYGDTRAIHDLAFEIDKGEIVGFLGLNGAGKTTTLRILACLLLPSTGEVRVNGVNALENPHDVRKLLGFLPEAPPLYDEMTVEDFLLFAGQLRGLARTEADKCLGRAMELTNITDVREKVIGALSHGYRQRVGLAQAVIHDPPVLILDEPIKGLDPVQIVEVREMIRNLSGKHTILISSHILTEISQTCDRILMIKDGEIVATGTEDELTASLALGHKLQLVARGEREALLGCLRAVDGVVDCDDLPAELQTHRPPRDADIVCLLLTTKEDRREAISRAVVEGGFGLLQLSPAAAELESAFLKLSGQHGAATDAVSGEDAPADAAPAEDAGDAEDAAPAEDAADEDAAASSGEKEA